MMTLRLKRNEFRSDGILGELTEDGTHLAFTLEHAYATASHSGTYAPKIPPGSYLCRRGLHRLHDAGAGFDTYEITQVAGHTGLLFHCGNTASDSEGCVLLGKEAQKMPVLLLSHSREAFASFLEHLANAPSFFLTVID